MSDRTREMATVRENSRILDGYYKMTLHAPVIAQRCRPGQFVFIRVGSGTAPLLRRPISICEADSIGGTLTLLYRVVGTGTDLLSAVRAGQALDVMGPIGTPFPVEGEQAILVAGGMGAAPLCMLARALHDAGSAVTVYLGCRDAAHDLCGKTLRTYGTVHTAYESEGRLVTDILPETAAGPHKTARRAMCLWRNAWPAASARAPAAAFPCGKPTAACCTKKSAWTDRYSRWVR